MLQEREREKETEGISKCILGSRIDGCVYISLATATATVNRSLESGLGLWTRDVVFLTGMYVCTRGEESRVSAPPACVSV